MTDSTHPSRNWWLTLACIPLCLVALWFSVAVWFVTFEGLTQFELLIRVVLCLVFAYSTYKLAVVIKRGSMNVRMRDIARDFFAGM